MKNFVSTLLLVTSMSALAQTPPATTPTSLLELPAPLQLVTPET